MTSQSSCWAVSDRVTRGGLLLFSLGAVAAAAVAVPSAPVLLFCACEFALSIFTVTRGAQTGKEGVSGRGPRGNQANR